MKLHNILLALGAASATAIAGTPYVAPAPAPEPSAAGWFFGGSFGQFEVDNNLDSVFDDAPIVALFEDSDPDFFEDTFEDFFSSEPNLPEEFFSVFNNIDDETTINGFNESLPEGFGFLTRVSDVDLDMYTIHLGRELGNAGGFDMSAFLELGWLTGDMNLSVDYYANDRFEVNVFREQLDIDVIPLTINFKVERMFTSSVGAYLSAGLGYAWTNLEADNFSIDESDGGFYAHAAAGLVWNVNESFELFGGARWVHLESLEFGNSGFELEDTLGWEVGARVNF